MKKRKSKTRDSRKDLEGYLVTLDEMGQPDWHARLEKGIRELDEGRGIELEVFLRKLKRRRTQA